MLVKPSTINSVHSSSSPSADTWYDLTVTYINSTNTFEFYVDGVSQGTVNPTGSDWTGSEVRIGQRANTNYHDGHVSSLQIFNKALASTEVSSLYNSGEGVTYRELFPLSDGLEAYYKLDGDATDATANGNNGTVVGATSGLQGKIGTAYDFDGTNDYIDLGNNVSLNPTTAITLSAWVNIPPSPTMSGVLIARRSTTEYAYDLSFSSADGKFYFGINSNTNRAITTTNFKGAGWKHLTAVYDGSFVKVYVDGELENWALKTGVITTTSEKTYLGRRGTGWTGTSIGYFDGTIDEPLIMSRALTPGEIRRLYSFGAGLRYEDLDNTSPLIDGIRYCGVLEGDFTDAKNNTFNGTGSGPVVNTLNKPSVNFSASMYFDGVNDWANIIHNADLSSDSSTWFVWVKGHSSAGPTNVKGIIGKYSNTGFDRELSVIFTTAPPGAIVTQIGNAAASAFAFNDTGSTNYYDQNWHLVTIVKQYRTAGDTFRTYIGSNVQLESVTSVRGRKNNSNFEWGRLSTGSLSSRYFQGYMSQTGIYKRALSSTEVSVLNTGIKFPFSTTTPETPSTNNSLYFGGGL